MRIIGIKSVDYNELQIIQKNVFQYSGKTRTLTGPARVEALRRTVHDARLYESGRAELSQTYPEALVDFLPICLANQGKVIFIPFMY